MVLFLPTAIAASIHQRDQPRIDELRRMGTPEF